MLLVTGGTGFIGSVLLAELEATRAPKVAVCDWIDSPHKGRNISKRGNLASVVPPERLDDFLERDRRHIEAIFHLASSGTGSTEGALPRLWRFAAERGIPLIFAASAGGVVDGKAPPFWTGLRFRDVYGPNEYHKGDQRSDALVLYEQIRDTGRARLHPGSHDYVWVGDCAQAMIWLWREGRQSGLFDCRAGLERPSLDLARAVFQEMDKEPVVDWVAAPDAGPCDPWQLPQAAGYTAPFTTLEEGVGRYLRDYLAAGDPYW